MPIDCQLHWPTIDAVTSFYLVKSSIYLYGSQDVNILKWFCSFFYVELFMNWFIFVSSRKDWSIFKTWPYTIQIACVCWRSKIQSNDTIALHKFCLVQQHTDTILLWLFGVTVTHWYRNGHKICESRPSSAFRGSNFPKTDWQAKL